MKRGVVDSQDDKWPEDFDQSQLVEFDYPRRILAEPIEELNFSLRTYNVLKACAVHTVVDLCRRSASDLLNMRNFGVTCLNEVKVKLKSLGLNLEMTEAELAELQRDLSDRRDQFELIKVSYAVPHLEIDTHLLQWVYARTGDSKLNDLLEIMRSGLPMELVTKSNDARRIELRSSNSEPRSIGESLHELFDSLTEKQLSVIDLRFGLTDGVPRTLDEIGNMHGVTRERIRQVQLQSMARLKERAAGSNLDEFFKNLGDYLGGVMPTEVFEAEFPGLNMWELNFINFILGEPLTIDEHYIARSGLSLPSVEDLPLVRDCDYLIDELAAIEELEALGIGSDSATLYLEHMNGLFQHNENYLRTGNSIIDKALAILEAEDEPLEVDFLWSLTDGGSERSFRDRLFGDSRVVRVTKSKVGLARWGGMVYSGIIDAMLQTLASGPVDLDELAIDLASRYEVSPSSIYMFSVAPIFKTSGGVIALRAPGDRYVSRHDPNKVAGLRILGPTLFELDQSVDTDMLRGSGRSLPPEVANLMNLAPGDEPLLLTTDLGSLVPLGWPMTSHTGPQIGSLKLLADANGISLGETVTLRFSALPPTLSIKPTTN